MADQKISALTAASSVVAANEFAINEAATSKKVTAQQIKDYVSTATVLAAGSASANTWPKHTNGTVLTTPEANAFENDGATPYFTVDTTNGRAQIPISHTFRLNADGSALGAGIADYFGSNSSLPTVTNGIYELIYYCVFTKTTAGTVTWTVTNTQAYTSCWGFAHFTGVAGMSLQSGPTTAFGPQTTAASAFPASGSLTTAVDHCAILRVFAQCGTAGNIRLRVTSSAGTVTPRRGSYYNARRLVGNVGTFAA